MEQRILAAVDGSKKCSEALRDFAGLMGSHPDCRVELFHCVRVYPGFTTVEMTGIDYTPRIPSAEQEEIGRTVLKDAEKTLIDNGFPAEHVGTRLKTDSASPAQDILDEAGAGGFPTVWLSRRGLNPAESILLGSTSNKVAQYGENRHIWVMDAPLKPTRRVLIAADAQEECKTLTRYAIDAFGKLEDANFTLFHVTPAMPPYLWDDGHILSDREREDRELLLRRWRSQSRGEAQNCLEAGRDMLNAAGVPPGRVEVSAPRAQEGIARDIVYELGKNDYQVAVIGKKSFQEKKPFLLGSHANKVLQNARKVLLCMVASEA
jgi:nucleotide-binding universal stress UspA family protein